MTKPGTRVGAVLSASKDEVKILGFGVYVGDERPPGDIVFFGGLLSEIYERQPEFSRDYTNPKIQLDNGDVVWGCECWWGPEEEVKKRWLSDGRRVVEVRMEPIREEARVGLRKEKEKKG